MSKCLRESHFIYESTLYIQNENILMIRSDTFHRTVMYLFDMSNYLIF